MLLSAITIFLSSFLLFQVQPLIAKIILPWFGGSAAVWNTCMLFFQLTLLAGYAYAHAVHQRLNVKRQAIVHISLLAVATVLLPILPDQAWKPDGSEDPVFLILGLLAATVGLPYLVLSTTGPLVQAWYAREHRQGQPYRLFALSNAASLLALITYPLLVEPSFDVDVQAWFWSVCFIVFAGLCGYLAWRSRRFDPLEKSQDRDDIPSAPSGPIKGLWILFAAVPSMLMLTVTTHLTQDIAAIPFLWIIPLILYLLSFILCFESSRLYWRWFYIAASLAALGSVAWAAELSVGEIGLLWEVLLYASSMFVCSMVCHGELARLKPHPTYLTGFFLYLSMGGAVGGLFVGLVAPMTFDTYAEFGMGWWLAALCIAITIGKHFWPRVTTTFFSVGVTAAVFALLAYGIMWLGFVNDSSDSEDTVTRNFYGRLQISESGDGADRRRKMIHGSINHGTQFLHGDRRYEPTTYYCPASGVGKALLLRRDAGPLEVGIIGVGTGTLATYGLPDDHYHMFDINPSVLELAQSKFTYLAESDAHVTLHLGDARLVLERRADLMFDMLVVDAFSSDSVPVHLVTKEAFELYLSRLKPDGILAVHISNRYLNMQPVVAANARALGLSSRLVDNDRDDDDIECSSTTWTLHYRKDTERLLGKLVAESAELEADAGFRMWTDRFSNLWSILKR